MLCKTDIWRLLIIGVYQTNKARFTKVKKYVACRDILININLYWFQDTEEKTTWRQG